MGESLTTATECRSGGVFEYQTPDQSSNIISTIRTHCQSSQNISVESLCCHLDCSHQRSWLPVPNNKSEKVCVSRMNETTCVEHIVNTDDEDNGGDGDEGEEDDSDGEATQQGSSHLGDEKEGELHRLPRLKIPGSLEHPLSPEDLRNLQVQDETATCGKICQVRMAKHGAVETTIFNP